MALHFLDEHTGLLKKPLERDSNHGKKFLRLPLKVSNFGEDLFPKNLEGDCYSPYISSEPQEIIFKASVNQLLLLQEVVHLQSIHCSSKDGKHYSKLELV